MLIKESVMNDIQQMQINNIYTNELINENTILSIQLHEAYKELEKCNTNTNMCDYNMQNKSTNKNLDIIQKISNIYIENIKLNALVSQQKLVFHTERENSLTSKLGKTLIHGVSSTKEFIKLPFKLLKIWKSFKQTCPPSLLGGETFQKLIEAYTSGGIISVEKLLNSTSISSEMRANAYTALARKMRNINNQQAAHFAKIAWEIDPRPYRLKWLAFILHDAKQILESDVIIDILPQNISLTETEKRRIQRIRHDAQAIRIDKAQKSIEDIHKVIINYNDKIKTLKQENLKIYKKLDENQIEIANLKETHIKQQNKIEKLKQENSNIYKQLDETHIVIANLRETHIKQQNEIKYNIQEYNNLSMQTAKILKNILSELESDTSIYLRILRIIMGVKVKY